jgi:hypothetical protein
VRGCVFLLVIRPHPLPLAGPWLLNRPTNNPPDKQPTSNQPSTRPPLPIPHHHSYPVRELWGRAKSAWATILSHAQPGERVLVVAHSGINQALALAALGHGPGMYRRLNFVNCGAIHLRLRLPASPEHAHKLAHRGGYVLPMPMPRPLRVAVEGGEVGGRGSGGGSNDGQEAAGAGHYRVVHPADWEPEMHAPAVVVVEEAEMAGKR